MISLKRRDMFSATAIGMLPVADVIRPEVAEAATACVAGSAVKAIPLSDVRLLPSPWLTAVESNRRYLLSLEPDRLLHNFRRLAGLDPKGEIYGGWENDTIAGHTLGHYLSALSLMYAQTGDAECLRRVHYIVDELETVQKKQGDGYVAGFTRKGSGGKIEDGKIIFTEILNGDIRSGGFDLNGAWSPLYNIHKTFAGLFDAQTYCGNQKALAISILFAGFFENFYKRLTENQLQKVLQCEYGGLNESFAELFARTQDDRWLDLSRKTYDRKSLDPLVAGKDNLAHLHSNTQIPKIIGLARISEVSKAPDFSTASHFFWDRVTGHYSFAIGGNGDREYFFEPDSISQHLTEQTCEHCCSYNMLKLTRQLYARDPHADYFDYYERTHLNHVLAAQDPENGMFTYMTPMITGGVRGWSDPVNDFWCCVGTGIESHAKHGDSIWWETKDGLCVNLYIPSRMYWRKENIGFTLETGYPYDGAVSLKVTSAETPKCFVLSLRIPGWVSGKPEVSVNGEKIDGVVRDGYLALQRVWTTGDQVSLILPMSLRTESPSDDRHLVTLAHGPMLLAADLGPVEDTHDMITPALVTENLVEDLQPVTGQAAHFQTSHAGRPGQLTFVPFYAQYRRRSGLYLQCFSADEWRTEEQKFREEQHRQKALAARTVDVMYLGEMQQEHDHGLTSKDSYPLIYRNRNGRDVRRDGFIQFTIGVRQGPMLLQTTMWRQDIEKSRGFRMLINGSVLPPGKIEGPSRKGFADIVVDIPVTLTQGKSKVTVRIEPPPGRSAGPFFGVRVFQKS
jgi:DUF1680 family protein